MYVHTLALRPPMYSVSSCAMRGSPGA
jgi:hypothetical protein